MHETRQGRNNIKHKLFQNHVKAVNSMLYKYSIMRMVTCNEVGIIFAADTMAQLN